MKLPVFLIRREMAAPVFTLIGASVVSVSLLSAKIILSGRWSHLYLIWNLFLAWLPLLLALMVCHRYETTADRGWKFLALGGAWLLFLRWNSWDAVLNPWDLLGDMVQPVAHPLAHRHDTLFIAVFGLFVFLAYSTVYSLIHFRVAVESGESGAQMRVSPPVLPTSDRDPTRAGPVLA